MVRLVVSGPAPEEQRNRPGTESFLRNMLREAIRIGGGSYRFRRKNARRLVVPMPVPP